MSENNIVNPNAEEQEPAAVAEVAATTNEPVGVDATQHEPVLVAEPVVERIVTAHDDFDWSIDKRNVAAYTKEEKDKV